MQYLLNWHETKVLNVKLREYEIRKKNMKKLIRIKLLKHAKICIKSKVA